MRTPVAQAGWTRQPRSAILYYLVAGIGAAGIAISSGLGAASAATAGCGMVFAPRASHLQVDPTADTYSCAQYVDVPGFVLTAVVAGLLLTTARQLLRPPANWGAPVAGGIVVGAVLGAVPLSFVAWAVDFYRLRPGPVELAVALLPLAWAVRSGFLAWRTAARSPVHVDRRP